MKIFKLIILSSIFTGFLLFTGCDEENDNSPEGYPDVNRLDKLPSDIVKRTPETDLYPPILHSNEFEEPVPMTLTINTSGAEDSPYFVPYDSTLYFFFTPDVRVEPQDQLLDEVSGVWKTVRVNGEWTEPERVWLTELGKLALDGAVAVQNNEMWFASAREGYEGVNMFTAEKIGGEWMNWTYCGDRLMKDIGIGEVHIYGDELFFHADIPGGTGDYDIWSTKRVAGSWMDPVNISAVNSSGMDGFPFVSKDYSELWFTRTYNGTPAVYRSKRVVNEWTTPELIVSQFAGEPTLDDEGNLYFVHHFYENDVMIEADIYVAVKK